MMMKQEKIFTLRFWSGIINIKVGGKYSHDFETFEDAWNAANAFMKWAHDHGADAIDINNDFYDIIDD